MGKNYYAGKQKDYNTDVFTDTALSFIKKQIRIEETFFRSDSLSGGARFT